MSGRFEDPGLNSFGMTMTELQLSSRTEETRKLLITEIAALLESGLRALGDATGLQVDCSIVLA